MEFTAKVRVVVFEKGKRRGGKRSIKEKKRGAACLAVVFFTFRGRPVRKFNAHGSSTLRDGVIQSSDVVQHAFQGRPLYENYESQ